MEFFTWNVKEEAEKVGSVSKEMGDFSRNILNKSIENSRKDTIS